MNTDNVVKKFKSDKQMLKLIELLKNYKVIRFDNDFCDAIGLKRQNLTRIKNNKSHFTPLHLENAIKKYKVNANWLFEAEENVFRRE